MAVAVSRDLTVQVLEDANAVKLTDRQKALQAAVQKGEPKSLGVSQVMLGLMVMSYSVPLHFTEVTEVVRLGVPWWSGLMFITAGVFAIILDKRCTVKTLQMCLMLSLLSALLAVAALIIYSVDLDKDRPCVSSLQNNCKEVHFALTLSKGLKSTLLVFTLAQTIISSILCFLLFRQRHSFTQYTSLSQAAPPTPSTLVPPDLN